MSDKAINNKQIINWIEIVDSALEKAQKNHSKLTAETLSIPGMSGHKTRHFLNNVVQGIGGRYLEIGVWKGSTFCSALYNSVTNNYCVAIDNWSEFSGPRNEFQTNLQRFVDLENLKVRVLEKDYREITANDLLISHLGKFPIYLYDGPHKRQDHYDALSLYLQYLENDFVFLCDDWNWTDDVEVGTRQAFDKLKIVVHREWVMTTPNNIDHDQPGWWNGYYAAVCSKS